MKKIVKAIFTVSLLYKLLVLILTMFNVSIYKFNIKTIMLWVLALIILAVVLLIVSLLIVGMYSNFINRKFAKEYQPIIKQFERDKDYHALYRALKNIKHLPKGKGAESAYYFSLSTGAFYSGRKEEGWEYLNHIVAYTEQIQQMIHKQAEDFRQIESKSESSFFTM